MLALPQTWAIGADALLALSETDALALATGALSLAELREFAPTVVIATPSDTLRLAHDAGHDGVDLSESPLRLVVLTGEPGGSLSTTRRVIEAGWSARCLDVYALTELGVIGWSCDQHPGGIHLDDRELVFTACLPDTDRPAPPGEVAELLVTTPADWSTPLANFRTGDLLRLEHTDGSCGRSAPWAAGGVLGRARECVRMRGHDLLPSTIEQIVRRHPAVLDFRMRVYAHRGDCEVAVELEASETIASEGDRARVAAEVAEDVKRSIGLRLHCDVLPAGSFSHDYDAGRRARRLRRQ